MCTYFVASFSRCFSCGFSCRCFLSRLRRFLSSSLEELLLAEEVKLLLSLLLSSLLLLSLLSDEMLSSLLSTDGDRDRTFLSLQCCLAWCGLKWQYIRILSTHKFTLILIFINAFSSICALCVCMCVCVVCALCVCVRCVCVCVVCVCCVCVCVCVCVYLSQITIHYSTKHTFRYLYSAVGSAVQN